MIVNLNSCKSNKGFSVIELLIAMLVATIIVLGVYRFLTSSHRSFTFTKANDSVNRSIMLSNRTLTSYLRMAGFRNYRRVIDSVTFEKRTVNFGTTSKEFPLNTYVIGADSTGSTDSTVSPAVATQPNDQLYIRYYGSSIDDDLSEKGGELNINSNERMFDCNGNPVSRLQEVFLRFYVTADGLTCDQHVITFNNSGTSVVGQKTESGILIDNNVISILFGFRIDGDDTFYLSKEVNGKDNSTKKLSTSNYEIVNAMRYGILVREDTHQKVSKIKDTRTFHMLGFSTNDDVATAPASESNIYQLVSGVVYMRNRYIETN